MNGVTVARRAHSRISMLISPEVQRLLLLARYIPLGIVPVPWIVTLLVVEFSAKKKLPATGFPRPVSVTNRGKSNDGLWASGPTNETKPGGIVKLVDCRKSRSV